MDLEHGGHQGPRKSSLSVSSLLGVESRQESVEERIEK